MIEDYLEGHVEPVDVAPAGEGENHIELALVGSAGVELTLCSVIMYLMCECFIFRYFRGLF